MCGIAGLVIYDSPAVDKDLLQKMNDHQCHRGPDGQGVYIDGSVGLAHRRLAVIDPKGGHQPFISADGQVVVTYNGEIYNYKEIQQELAGEFVFSTTSDTEVLVNAYRKWGINCLRRFRGMFAFVLYDKAVGTLYVVRDRIGIKPLYYLADSRRFIFASELGAITALPDIPIHISPEAVAEYFRYYYVPGPHSIYKDIHKLEPAHYLKVDLATKNVTKHCYWEVGLALAEKSEKALLAELDELLHDIVSIYVRSDVPFGAFFSGGVDSSIVTAYMTRCLTDTVKTFTIGYDDEAFSELPYALEAAQILGTDHKPQIVHPDYSVDFVASLIRHFGEPFADSSLIPTYYVSQLAAQHVKMVLSGDGGDELFGGYNSYRDAFTHNAGSAVRGLLRHIAGGLAGRTLLAPFRWRTVAEIQRSQREVIRGHELKKLLRNPDWVQEKPSLVVPRDAEAIHYFQLQDVNTYMVDDVLTKVDRMSMANSLEVRVPLLDHKLVEFAFTLQLRNKLRREDGRVTTKYLLKKAAQRFFPPSFLERPKQGFGIPIASWLRGADGALRVFLDKEAPVYEYLDYRYTAGMINSFLAGDRSLTTKVWGILIFALWLDNVHYRNS